MAQRCARSRVQEKRPVRAALVIASAFIIGVAATNEASGTALGKPTAKQDAPAAQVPDALEEPMRFFVKAEPKGEKKVVKNIKKAAKELEKKLKKDKKWFELVDSEDRAEIIIEVMTHLVDERSYTRTETRYSVNGNQLVDVNIMQEQHRIEAEVSFFGRTRRMEGVEPYEAGGNAKNAAGNLAELLQRHVRENYASLLERREN